jgi:hypothetical protein
MKFDEDLNGDDNNKVDEELDGDVNNEFDHEDINEGISDHY